MFQSPQAIVRRIGFPYIHWFVRGSSNQKIITGTRVHTILERIVPHSFCQQTEISALFTQPFLWCLDVYITAARNIFYESPNLHEIDFQAISLKIQSVEEICVERSFLELYAL